MRDWKAIATKTTSNIDITLEVKIQDFWCWTPTSAKYPPSTKINIRNRNLVSSIPS